MDSLTFLRGLWHGVSGIGEIRFIHPETAHVARAWVNLPLRAGEARWLGEQIEARNAAGYGVYYRFGVGTERSAKKRDIHWITALWVDIDDADGHQWIDDLPYCRVDGRQIFNPPTVVIRSGVGWHGLWMLRQPVEVADSAAVERVLKGIAVALRGDPAATDITRIFRLPGTINTKPGRGMICTIEDIVPRRYDWHDIVPGLESFMPTETHAPGRYIAPAAYANAGLPRWVESYIAGGAPVGERNRTLFAAACEYAASGKLESEAASVLVPRALADGLAEREAQAAVRSGYAYAARHGVRPALGNIQYRYNFGENHGH